MFAIHRQWVRSDQYKSFSDEPFGLQELLFSATAQDLKRPLLRSDTEATVGQAGPSELPSYGQATVEHSVDKLASLRGFNLFHSAEMIYHC